MVVAVAFAIDLLVGGFLVMTYAMKLLTITYIIKGIVGLAAIVLGMAGFMKLIDKMNPSPKAILALLPIAIALDLLIVGFAAMLLIMKVISRDPWILGGDPYHLVM